MPQAGINVHARSSGGRETMIDPAEEVWRRFQRLGKLWTWPRWMGAAGRRVEAVASPRPPRQTGSLHRTFFSCYPQDMWLFWRLSTGCRASLPHLSPPEDAACPRMKLCLPNSKMLRPEREWIYDKNKKGTCQRPGYSVISEYSGLWTLELGSHSSYQRPQ